MKGKADRPTQAPGETPDRLLLAHYRRSRDGWKARALSRSASIKSLEQKIRDLQDSRSSWKDKAMELRATNLSLLDRLEQLALQRDHLQTQLADALSKKALPPAL